MPLRPFKLIFNLNFMDYITKFRNKVYRFNEIPILKLPKVTKYRETKFRRIKIPTKRTA
jgi:hypothetical protein